MGSLLYVVKNIKRLTEKNYTDAPFQAAVDAGVGAVMCSYNKVAGISACEQNQTLHDLKNGMGFEVRKIDPFGR